MNDKYSHSPSSTPTTAKERPLDLSYKCSILLVVSSIEVSERTVLPMQNAARSGPVGLYQDFFLYGLYF